jgi:hypothetical protein
MHNTKVEKNPKTRRQNSGEKTDFAGVALPAVGAESDGERG